MAEDTKNVQKDFDNLKADVAELCKTVAQLSENQAKQFTQAAAAKGRKGIDAASKEADALAERLDYERLRAEETIKENPLVSLLIALGLGVLVGRLFGKR